jgi:hypothetical protein
MLKFGKIFAVQTIQVGMPVLFVVCLESVMMSHCHLFARLVVAVVAWHSSIFFLLDFDNI